MLMNEIFEKQHASPDALFSFIPDQLITREHRYGFRGHADHQWKLEPTAMRFIDQIEAAHPERKADRVRTGELALKRLLEAFRTNLIVNHDLPEEAVERIDLWQYGQHFGLPSPLLDWTHSPYVALFFALSSPTRSELDSRCVWVLNLEMLGFLNRAVLEEVRPKHEDRLHGELLDQQFPLLEIVEEVSQHNRRVAFQQGFFTKHVHYRSLEIWLTRIVKQLHFNRGDRPVLQKHIFPCTEPQRLAVLDKLDKMNINNRTLFPDVYGSVKGAIDSTIRSFGEPRTKTFSVHHEPDGGSAE
jgi:hypothetical protein